jgi:pimeloyl-ACP methyl ester carboxylesterase
MHVVERRGNGPTVVCVHGYCQSSAYWTPTLDRLAEVGGVTGIAPDLPGFGASAEEAGPYTMESYADRLASLLDIRRIERVIVVGGSMGGVVAQHFALRHPNRLARMLLVATGGATADPAAALAKAEQLTKARWDEATVTPIVDGFFHQSPSQDMLSKYRQIALSASQAAAVEAARSNARSRTLERLSEIAVPALIIQGAYDRARTPEHGTEMARRIRDARLEVLERVGHTPQLEDPAAFHSIALPFLLAQA